MPGLAALQAYLHEHIPLSRAMQVSVEHAGFEKVILHAPLAPNINHRDTVFGGSASALAILAAWTLLYVRLQSIGISARVVIQRNQMEYLHAISDDFDALVEFHDAAVWEKFLLMLRRRQRARLTVSSQLICHGEIVGRLQGEFVALYPG